MLTVPKYAAISSDLAVLTCFFNPFGCQHLQDNYTRFADAVRASGVPLFTVECLFAGDQPFVESDGQTLHVQAESRCWQKERLLNLLETHVPAQYTKLAWVDADVLFDNPAWAHDTSELLDEFALLQLFERAIWMNKKGEDTTPANVPVTGQDYHSFTSRLPGSLSGHPGYAWAIRRSVWKACGLFDRSGATSADFLMALASVGACAKQSGTVTGVADCYLQWADQFRRLVGGSIGTAPGVIRHLWHGDAVARNYSQFEQSLQTADFDPRLDLVLADNGTWIVPADRLQVQQVFNDYFQSRADAANQIDLSIITATRNRHDQLANRLHSMQLQTGSLSWEHIVVVDGADDWASVCVCRRFGVEPLVLPVSGGGCGAQAKAMGIAAASGRYVALWDDDDIYYANAAQDMLDSAQGFDIGICQVNQLTPLSATGQCESRILPGGLEFGSWTQMSMTVRRELAVAESIWDGDTARGTDWRWYQRLLRHKPQQNFSGVMIGCFVDTYQMSLPSS